MKNKIAVLGAGLVGKAIATDLSKNNDVTSIDINEDALHQLKGIKTHKADLSDLSNLKNILQPFDLVVGAVPGFMGFQTVKTVIEAGKNMVDISFFPEDAFLLDELAKKHDV